MKEKILITDDDQVIQKIVRGVLTKEGYEVSSALNGPDCIKAIRSFAPDLVLLDIHMEKMDGIKVLQTLRLDPFLTSLPIMMFTSASDRETIDQVLGNGADDFIVKPFGLEDLKSRVVKLLFRPDYNFILSLLSELRFHDQGHLKEQGLELYAKLDFQVYPVDHNGMSFLVLLPKNMPPQTAINLPEDTARKQILIFKKSLKYWRQLWPYLKESGSWHPYVVSEYKAS